MPGSLLANPRDRAVAAVRCPPRAGRWGGSHPSQPHPGGLCPSHREGAASAVGWEGDFRRLQLAAPCSPGSINQARCLFWYDIFFPHFLMIFAPRCSANTSRPWGGGQGAQLGPGGERRCPARRDWRGHQRGPCAAPRSGAACAFDQSSWFVHKVSSLIPWGLPLSSCCETFICF